jgi:predicted DCC family thiol-disulfide oxidoreductase YuxK
LSDHEAESILPREGWILYDGGCGFCFRWVHLWKKVVGRRGFALKDLQSASGDGGLQISQENLLDDIRVLTRSGKLESGADEALASIVARDCVAPGDPPAMASSQSQNAAGESPATT